MVAHSGQWACLYFCRYHGQWKCLPMPVYIIGVTLLLIISEQCRVRRPQQEEFHALILHAVLLDFLQQFDGVAVPALSRIGAYSVDVASRVSFVGDRKNREGGDCLPLPLQSICPAKSESLSEEQIQK